MKPCEEIVSFIASTAGAERLDALRPAKAAEQRAERLPGKLKDGTIRPAVRRDLDLFVRLDHVMSLAKARARAKAT